MRQFRTMSNAPLRRLASLCSALARGDDVAARELLVGDAAAWAALRQAADEHRLTGYLYAELQAQGLDTSVPPAVLLHARRVYLQQWTRAGQLLREIERLAQAFEARGLPVLFFKGPLLAARLYEHLGSRAIHAIDFLLRDPRTLPRYDEVLAALGYRRVSRLLLPLAWSGAWFYQLEYRSDAFALEPHWKLQNHPSVALDLDRMWSQAGRAATTGARTVPMLSDEYTLVANLLSIPADLQNASLLLRTYVELLLLWRRFPADYDWTAFWARRRAERTQRLAAATLALLREVFASDALDRAAAAAPASDDSKRLAAALEVALFGARTHDGPTAPGSTQDSGPVIAEGARRRLAWELFETPLALSFLWWSVTLPARALAHPAVTLRRLRW